MRTLGLLVFVLLTCVACGDNKLKGEIHAIDIESNVFNIEKIYLSDYSKGVKYIPLEVNEDFLIVPNAIIARITDEYILIYDSKACLLYDRDGHFIRPIGRQGRGPGEYTTIGWVDLSGETVYICDFFKLIEYKIDGTHIKDNKDVLLVDGKYRIEDAFLINDSLILGNIDNRTGKEAYKAFLVNKNGSVMGYYPNFIKFNLDPGVSHAKSPGSAFYYEFNDKFFFKEFLNDTLFWLDNYYRLEPSYTFDLGKYKLPVSERGKDWSQVDLTSYIDVQNAYQTEGQIIIVCDYAKYFPAKRITPKTIFLPSGNGITMWQNTSRMLGVYDKKSGNLVFSEPTDTDNLLFSTGFYNDIDAGPRFIPTNIVNDSIMAMKVDFYDLLKHVDSDDFKNNIPKNPEQKVKLAAMVDSLKNIGFDNPVYMLVTFRND